MNSRAKHGFPFGLIIVLVSTGACFFLATYISSTAVSAENEKSCRIAVVNLQSVLKRYTRSTKFQEEWEAKRNEIEKALLALESQMANKKRELEHTLRTTERYAELYREITLLRQRLEFDSEFMMKQHYSRGEKRQREIFLEIEAAVKACAVDKKLTAVFMAQELPEKIREKVDLNSYFQDVLYYDKSVDISDVVVEVLNRAWGSVEPPKEK